MFLLDYNVYTCRRMHPYAQCIICRHEEEQCGRRIARKTRPRRI